MDAKAKTLWLKALRSGKYEQGKYFLKSDGQYCCLGVLCEVALKNGVKLAKADDGHEAAYGIEKAKEVLPTEVCHWAKISENPEVEIKGIEDANLACLNDHEGYNFLQIADVIEEQL